jgi:hypothetical protein
VVFGSIDACSTKIGPRCRNTVFAHMTFMDKRCLRNAAGSWIFERESDHRRTRFDPNAGSFVAARDFVLLAGTFEPGAPRPRSGGSGARARPACCASARRRGELEKQVNFVALDARTFIDPGTRSFICVGRLR